MKKPCPGRYSISAPCGHERDHLGDCGPAEPVKPDQSPKSAWVRVGLRFYADGNTPNEIKEMIEDTLSLAGEASEVLSVHEEA